jgi:hypothetical protein
VELNYYTIEQAARKLECMPDEIEHLILTDEIEAQLYSNLKKFIVLEKVGEQLFGKGIATYEGLIKTRNSYTRQLVQKQKITIDVLVALMQPQNIRNWNKNHHYKSDDFMRTGNIFSWAPYELAQAREPTRLLAIPMLHEGPGMLNFFNKALEAIAKNQGRNTNGDIKLEPAPEYSYSFHQHGKYEYAALRITHADLTKYIEARQSSHETMPKIEAEIALPWCDSKKKHSRIDPVIERLYKSDTAASAKSLWNKLENDYELDEPLLDSNHVIQAMDGLVLDWKNRNKGISELQFKTFSNKISEIRIFYRSIT